MSHEESLRTYFAYGSNLAVEQRRKAGIDDNALTPLGVGFLPDRRLAFTRESRGWGGGVLDVVPQPGAVVEGMLFSVRDPSVWALLDQKEGVRSGAYRRFSSIAFLDDGTTVPVTSYAVVEPEPYVDPADDYLALVTREFERFGLDLVRLQAAAAPRKHARAHGLGLFVYGTLLPGESRGHALGGLDVELDAPARCVGTLYDFGPYPALHLSDTDVVEVQGRYLLPTDDSLASAIEELDVIEGFSGFGVEGSLFRRCLVDVATLDTGRKAWAYVVDAPPPGSRRIEGGSWPTHRKLRDEQDEA